MANKSATINLNSTFLNARGKQTIKAFKGPYRKQVTQYLKVQSANSRLLGNLATKKLADKQIKQIARFTKNPTAYGNRILKDIVRKASRNYGESYDFTDAKNAFIKVNRLSNSKVLREIRISKYEGTWPHLTKGERAIIQKQGLSKYAKGGVIRRAVKNNYSNHEDYVNLMAKSRDDMQNVKGIINNMGGLERALLKYQDRIEEIFSEYNINSRDLDFTLQ